MPSQLTPVEAVPFELEIARGNVANFTAVNIIGRNSDVDAAVEDIWTAAAAIPQILWVAPTQARTHAIVSTSTSDDGQPLGVGARTIRVYGLATWSTAESSEDITMDGTTGVNTASTYVMINRLEVLTKGATNINVGTITATAATDNSITAQIEPGRGASEMLIYGIPSTQNLYLSHIHASLGAGSGAAQIVDVDLRINSNPDVELLNYIIYHTLGLGESGNSHDEHEFDPFLRVPGPAIIKATGIASGTNNDVHAGLDAYLITE